MMDIPRYFYVETQRSDDTWHKFTVGVIEGESRAKEALNTVIEFAAEKNIDASHVRLHEMTEQEIAAFLFEVHREEFQRHVRELPLTDLLQILEQRNVKPFWNQTRA